MRAGYYERNGSARDVLTVGEIETPKPGPGEVRVRIAASGVNPSDVKTRAGTTRKMSYPRVVPHSDAAGTIDMTGDGVSPTRKGERVWVWNAAWKRALGSAAEFVVLPQEQAVPLPASISFAEGACLGIPAMTGYRAIELSGAQAGMTLLVAGGAGAVGQYAIQFAKANGAKVIATVSSAEKAKVAAALGADHTIDYRREDVGERVKEMTDGTGVDAVIEVDLSANAKLIPAVLRPKGSVIVYGTGADAALPAFFCLVNSIRLQFLLVYELSAEERARAIKGISGMLERGALRNHVAKTFPLDDIAAAHEAVEQGQTIGNVILKVS